MLTFVILLICIFLLFLITLTNYWRIERMVKNQRDTLTEARKEINALNTILLIRFKNKQRVEHKLLLRIVERIKAIERHYIDTDFNLTIDVDEIKTTLNNMMNDEKILYDFSDTQARLKELGAEKADSI
tara:strand:- start:884 stop:1270 length:387 start_codon:yes stop_codon:yes gene_type:complete